MENPLPEDQKRSLLLESCLGSGKVLRQFAVSFLDYQKNDVGSGSLIKVGERLFVATAAHLVPKNPTGRIWLFNRTGRDRQDGFPGFLKCGKHADATKDVGYFELHPEVAAEYFGHEDFCTTDHLADLGAGRENRGVIVAGAPAEYAKRLMKAADTAVLCFETMPYWTVPLNPAEWPKVDSAARAPDESIDVFLDYPDEECRNMETGEVTELPNPAGMSGGGVWDQGFETGSIWTTRDCKLFAVQGSWSSTHRYLRATQIKHWVDLIRTDYPELKPHFSAWH